VRVVARFDPPDALAASRLWREHHAPTLAEIPNEAVRIDTGRAPDGFDFVQILIEDEYADRFPAG
jgi:hypothetical protein